ncbi:glycosyltransferase family 4 protein [Candidatus Micrarchaeota archaeon]|nr:glycosyltransferase family 4 protein [Candidatus Micrarchaeota archaeon]
MNICFVNYSFAGTADAFAVKGRQLIGGGEVYLHDLCKLMQKQGHEVSVVQGGRVNDSFEFDGIPVTQVASKGRYWFNFEWPKGVSASADLVHLHDANHAYPKGSMGNTATFHGVSWDVPFSGFDPIQYMKWRSRNAFFQYLIRYAVKSCRRLVSVDSVLPRFVSIHMPRYKDRLTVIPNYVDLKTFYPKPRKHGRRLTILLPRNLTRNRGIDLMLSAFHRLNRDDVELWIAGTGPLQPLVERAASRDPRIKYWGHKDHYRDLPRLYQKADITVIPSRGVEGTSLSALEAMACGSVVVASRVGGIPDLIDHERTGFLCAPSVQSFEDTLAAVLEDSALRQRVRGRALAHVKRFALPVWQKRWLEFFDDVFP